MLRVCKAACASFWSYAAMTPRGDVQWLCLLCTSEARMFEYTLHVVCMLKPDVCVQAHIRFGARINPWHHHWGFRISLDRRLATPLRGRCVAPD